MLIVTWNVARLSTTLKRIDSDYSPSRSKGAFVDATLKNPDDRNPSDNISKTGTDRPKSKKRKPRPCDAFSHYISRHDADILCIQEHKIPYSQISSRSEPFGCSSIPGYESFWSCCVDTTKRGFNGVVTFARTGTVVSGDSAPLGSKELDDQGRCVMTDHGSFVVFNVYAPGGGHALEKMMRFLEALRCRMTKEREENGKNVVLCGDLNIAHRAPDLNWKRRLVCVDRILDGIGDVNDLESENSQWKLDLERNWDKILSVLQTKEVVPSQTTNVATGAKFNKFRIRVNDENRKILLGPAEDNEEYAQWRYNLSSVTYFNELLKKETVVREENVVSVETLTELMMKIGTVTWDLATQRNIALTDAGVNEMSPLVHWLDGITKDDGMVDTLRLFYPHVQGRYTCWNQNTNGRYSNDGSRIDYILVDTKFSPLVQKGDCESLRCATDPPINPHTEDAARLAATANGGFQPASFDGGGISSVPQQVLDTQFGTQHTGIIYTPPSYSDHVAMSLLFATPEDAALTLREKDVKTKKAQPHKSQLSISNFFSAKTHAAGASSTSNLKRGMTQKESDRSKSKDKAHKGLKKYFEGATNSKRSKPS